MKKKIMSTLLLSAVLLGIGAQTTHAAGPVSKTTTLSANIVSGGFQLTVPDSVAIGEVKIGATSGTKPVAFSVTNLTGAKGWNLVVKDASPDTSVVVNWLASGSTTKQPITNAGISVAESTSSTVGTTTPQAGNGSVTLTFTDKVKPSTVSRNLEFTVSPNLT